MKKYLCKKNDFEWIFLKSTILKKKLILKSRFWKKNCTQKLTFWFNFSRKVRIFLRFTCNFEKHIFVGKIFSKNHDFECKVFVRSMILNWKFFVWSDLGSTFWKRVRIWVKRFTTPQISYQLFYNALDFQLEILQFHRFWINLLNTRQISNENFTSCHIFSVLLLQQAKFSCVHHNRTRSCNVLRYGVGSVSQVNVSEYAVCTPTVTNVTKRIKTANLLRVCSLIYVDKECYLTRFY